MTIEFIEQEFLKFYKGNRNLYCHIDAPHAASPQSDLFTDEITRKTLGKTDCSGIISKISRTVADLNRKPNGQNDEALRQYRRTVKIILQYLGILDVKKNQLLKPYLHLSIHGMKNIHHGPYAIEIGTLNGQSCSKEMKEWFRKIMTIKSMEIMPQINIIFDKKFDGDESIAFHRLGDGQDYLGYGDHFHTFQIEIAKTLREEHLTEIVELLSHVIIDFSRK